MKKTIHELRKEGNIVNVVHNRKFVVYDSYYAAPRYITFPFSKTNKSHLVTALKLNPSVMLEPRGGYTEITVINKEKRTRHTVVAECSDNDVYCYKRGVEIALGRLSVVLQNSNFIETISES